MNKHSSVSAHHHNNLKSHAKALVQATHHITDSTVSEARSKLNEIMESVSETVEDTGHFVVEKARKTDAFIKENPYKTAGIAVGVGVLFGLFLSRRQK